MATQIQTEYPAGMLRGQIGQKSRTNAPYDADRIKIGATGLKAGDLFALDANGDARPLTSATEAVVAVGVLMYEVSQINDDAGVIGEYPIGEMVPFMIEGYIVGESGGAIAKAGTVNFDPATHTWDAGTAVAGQKKTLTVVDDAVDGDLIEIKVGARV